MAAGSGRDQRGGFMNSGITSEFLENFSRVPVDSLSHDPDALLAWRLQNAEFDNDKPDQVTAVPSSRMVSHLPFAPPTRSRPSNLLNQRRPPRNRGRDRQVPPRGNLTIIGNNEDVARDEVDSVGTTEHGHPLAQAQSNGDETYQPYTAYSRPDFRSPYSGLQRSGAEIPVSDIESDSVSVHPSDSYLDTLNDSAIAQQLTDLHAPDTVSDNTIVRSLVENDRVMVPDYDNDEAIAMQLGHELNNEIEERDADLAFRLESEEHRKSKKDEENRQNRNSGGDLSRRNTDENRAVVNIGSENGQRERQVTLPDSNIVEDMAGRSPLNNGTSLRRRQGPTRRGGNTGSSERNRGRQRNQPDVSQSEDIEPPHLQMYNPFRGAQVRHRTPLTLQGHLRRRRDPLAEFDPEDFLLQTIMGLSAENMFEDFSYPDVFSELLPEEVDLNDYEALWELAERIGDVKGSGISEERLAELPVHKFEDGGNEEPFNECRVCLSEFSHGDQITSLPCMHKYHKECIERWLKRKDECPICRSSIGQ